MYSTRLYIELRPRKRCKYLYVLLGYIRVRQNKILREPFVKIKISNCKQYRTSSLSKIHYTTLRMRNRT